MSHRLRKPPRDRLTLLMAAVTALVFGLGLWAVTHLHDGNDSGHICTPVAGGRLDCR